MPFHVRLTIVALFAALAVISPALAQDDGAPLYMKAATASKGLGPGADTRAALDAAVKGTPDATVTALLADNAGALALLARASRVAAVDFNPEKKDTATRPVRGLVQLRNLCALTVVRARQRLDAKDAAGAAQDLETVLRVGRHLLSDRMLLYKAVGTAVIADALPTLQAHPDLPGLKAFLAGYKLPAPRAFVDDEKQLFVEAVAAASVDPGVRALGKRMVAQAKPLGERYYGILARQVDGDRSADAQKAITDLEKSLDTRFGSSNIGDILPKLQARTDLTDDQKAEVIDSALLCMVFSSLERPLTQYKTVVEALQKLR